MNGETTMTTTNKKAGQCRLERLEIENFMRCRVVRLDLGADPITEIRGFNGEGKSSVLQAVWALVGGKDACPADPIRHGADSAVIVGELDNGLIIRRKFTAKGSYLEVSTKEGASYKAPQKILDDLLGRTSFDPMAFLALDRKKQKEELQRIAGIDVTPFEQRRQAAYEARTLANRQKEGLKARLDAMPEVEAPDQELTAADLLAEQRKLQEAKSANDARRAELRRFADAVYKPAVAKVEAAALRVTELERQLAQAKEAHDVARAAAVAAAEQGKTLKAEVEALVDPPMDALATKIAEIDATNATVRAKKERARLAQEHVVAIEEWQRLDREVAAAEAEKTAALAKATFPVPGLGFSADGITYDGVPFDQASQAQRIRVSMAMGLALHPKLPIVCIRDGSLLDDRSKDIVREMAAAAGAKVLLEIVGKGGSGIVIEDGVVESIDGVPVQAPAEVA